MRCGGVGHQGVSCEEAADQDYKQAAEELNIKNCPKCNARTHKFDGCNHITCYRCEHQYCWLCLADYSEFHFSDFNIFGCAGLQNDQETRSRCNRGFLIIFCGLPALAVAVVVYLLGVVFVSLCNSMKMVSDMCSSIEHVLCLILFLLLFPAIFAVCLAFNLIFSLFCPCFALDYYDRS
jgi:E3 ubiquitin-protein ligase RNF19A